MAGSKRGTEVELGGCARTSSEAGKRGEGVRWWLMPKEGGRDTRALLSRARGWESRGKQLEEASCRGAGRGPAGGRAPGAGPLTCLGCSGAESAVAQPTNKERGKAALSERGGTLWPGGHCERGRRPGRFLVGTAPRARCWGGRVGRH